MRCDGLAALCIFNGPINGECVLAYVEQQPAPILKRGDSVVMDNLDSHKADAIRQLIRATGAHLFFLPPYSPDHNPIEQAFSKIKHRMRIAQRRTIPDTWCFIGRLVKTIKSVECANYFVNSGYAFVKT